MNVLLVRVLDVDVLFSDNSAPSQTTQQDVRIFCAGDGLKFVSNFVHTHPTYPHVDQVESRLTGFVWLTIVVADCSCHVICSTFAHKIACRGATALDRKVEGTDSRVRRSVANP